MAIGVQSCPVVQMVGCRFQIVGLNLSNRVCSSGGWFSRTFGNDFNFGRETCGFPYDPIPLLRPPAVRGTLSPYSLVPSVLAQYPRTNIKNHVNFQPTLGCIFVKSNNIFGIRCVSVWGYINRGFRFTICITISYLYYFGSVSNSC